MWDLDTLNKLQTLLGHHGHSVWDVDVRNNFLVTARWSTCPLSFLQLALGSRDLSQAEEKILLLQVEQLIK